MNSQIAVFNNPEFGEIRTVEDNGKVLFCGSDVAKALGYSNPRDAILRHCKGVVKHDGVSQTTNQYGITTNQTVEMSFIPEGDIYRLIAHSKLPSAEKFERWVFDEVLPTIRKHGAYMTSEVIERTLTDPDYLIRLATALKEERQTRQLAEKKIEAQKPLVDFAKHVTESSDSVDVGEFSKIVKNEKIDIGRNRLFQWLRENKYLMDTNIPYQKYINNGYFSVIEITKSTAYGTKVFPKTLITGRGQVVLVEKLRNEFGMNG